MVETFTSAASLFQRVRFGRAGRRDLLARLEPAEKRVRILMMMEAATFLLMTPEALQPRANGPRLMIFDDSNFPIEPWITHSSSRGWHHGVPENWNARPLAQPAFRAPAWVVARSEGLSETHKHHPGQATRTARRPPRGVSFSAIAEARALSTRQVAGLCRWRPSPTVQKNT